MYPRARLDALSDAVFGVAMTLLVLDVRLPDLSGLNLQEKLAEANIDLPIIFITG